MYVRTYVRTYAPTYVCMHVVKIKHTKSEENQIAVDS